MKAIDAIKILQDNNFEAYLVGGAVRNMLLNIPNEDEDIVTNATPDEIEKVFSDYKVDSVGKSFLVTIVEGLDISTYRLDHYTREGHCKAVQATSLQDDLARRDLTFNAIAYDPITETFIDPFDGILDLKNGIVRFVGDADERIKEDPCRILRACRFDALLKNEDNHKFLVDINNNKEMIREVAPERIQKEIVKVMRTCEYPSMFFWDLRDSGILDIILPELSECFYFDGGKHHSEFVHEHLLDTCDNLPHDPLLRIAGLFHDIGKPVVHENGKFITHEIESAKMTRRILKRLKFSNKFIDQCYGIIRLHMENITVDMKSKKIRKLIKKCFDRKINVIDLILVRFADQRANRSKDLLSTDDKNNITSMILKEIVNPDLVLCVKDLKVDGHDMMKIGYEGKEISEILNHLVKICIAVPENNNKDRLMIHAIGGRKKDLTDDEYLELRNEYKEKI